MKQIPKIYLQHARNAEHFLFHHNVLAIFTTELAALLKVEAYHATYAALLAQLIDGISAQALELRRAMARHGNG